MKMALNLSCFLSEEHGDGHHAEEHHVEKNDAWGQAGLGALVFISSRSRALPLWQSFGLVAASFPSP